MTPEAGYALFVCALMVIALAIIAAVATMVFA